MKITKQTIDAMVLPEKGDKTYFDENLKGFGVRVLATGVKSFVVERKVAGKKVRVTLGKTNELTPTMARERAMAVIQDIKAGVNPKDRKPREVVTLWKVLDDYLQINQRLKESTKREYTQTLQCHAEKLLKRDIVKITKGEIERNHHRIDKASQAAKTARYIRALFNFAIHHYDMPDGSPLVARNPVVNLFRTRAVQVAPPKTTYLERDDLKRFWIALHEIKQLRINDNHEVLRDYLLLVLFTGLRKAEAANLVWENVNFARLQFTVRNTKNKRDHTLPMSNFIETLLKRRHELTSRHNQFVFASNRTDGAIVNPHKFIRLVSIQTLNDDDKTAYRALERVKQYAAAKEFLKQNGVVFTMHDLRRTFAITAERLDLSGYTLKHLLNHKISDVTGGYVSGGLNVERLRQPMQAVTDALKRDCGIVGDVEEGGNVVKLSSNSR